MLLYLFRHGEITPNIAQVVGGWGDWPLTEKGEAQAAELRERVRSLPPFDRIYVSDLRRAQQTFRIAFGEDTPHIDTDLIREINAPFVGRKVAELNAELGEAYMKARRDMDYGEFSGESAESLRSRVQRFMEMAASSGCERVAAVCHGGAIRAAVAVAVGRTVPEITIAAGNCSATVLRYIEDEGVWIVEQINHTAELYGV